MTYTIRYINGNHPHTGFQSSAIFDSRDDADVYLASLILRGWTIDALYQNDGSGWSKVS